jgi:hypothetical protein
MDSDTSKLLNLLVELEELFRASGVDHWADWLKKDIDLISRGDFAGVSHLLSAYGGMGSMTDVYITPEAGYSITDEEVSQLNYRLSNLMSEIFSFATKMQREYRP